VTLTVLEFRKSVNVPERVTTPHSLKSSSSNPFRSRWLVSAKMRIATRLTAHSDGVKTLEEIRSSNQLFQQKERK
jgi:hypothetical protein